LRRLTSSRMRCGWLVLVLLVVLVLVLLLMLLVLVLVLVSVLVLVAGWLVLVLLVLISATRRSPSILNETAVGSSQPLCRLIVSYSICCCCRVTWMCVAGGGCWLLVLEVHTDLWATHLRWKAQSRPEPLHTMGYSPEVESPKPPRALTYHGLLTRAGVRLRTRPR
jgi:hypothetical protein